MGNAVEDALNRASAEQREQAYKVIEEARRNIKLVSMQETITQGDADNVTRNIQLIEDAKRSIPFETMQDVSEVSPPLPTPSRHAQFNATVVELDMNTKDTIDRIEQGGGNNYLQENAIDRAIARPAVQPQEQEQQQALGR